MLRKDFIRISLEVNLFFQRIMKEHLFFIETSMYQVDANYIAETDLLKRSFEELLSETVRFANGAISKGVIDSNELVTPYTLQAEEMSSNLTGVSLDTNITKNELNLMSDPNFDYTESLELWVSNLNIRASNLLREVITLKENLLQNILDCKMAIPLYPLLFEHIIREAKLYLEMLTCLQNKKLPNMTLCEELNFWNLIMEEHAEFIDGMLDPTEENLKETAEDYAELFEKLIEDCIKHNQKDIVNKSLKATEGIRDFKKAGVEGLLGCKIKSIILPLLADHVYREANHYIRLLKSIMK